MICQKILKNYAIRALTASLLAFPSYASAYTVQDAIIDAHQNNQGILAALDNLEAIRLEKHKAVAGFMPRAEFQAGFSEKQYKYQPAKRDLANRPQSRAFTITQPLYEGGKTFAGVLKAKNLISSVEADFRSKSNKLALDTVTAYEGVLTSKKLFEIAQQNEKLAKETLEYTKIRFKHGDVTKTEVLAAEANYSTAVASREGSEGSLTSAIAVLERNIGIKMPQHIESINRDAIPLPVNVEEFKEFSLENNPSLLKVKFDYETSRYDSMIATSAILPTVNAQASTQRSNSSKTSNTNSDGSTYSISVTVPIVAQGGAEYATIAQKRISSNGAEKSYRDARQQIEQNSIQAWSQYKTNLAQIKSQREAVNFNKSALDGIREEAKIGTKSTLDVLKVQQDWFNSQTELRKTEQQLVIAVYSIASLMGTIDSVDIEND